MPFDDTGLGPPTLKCRIPAGVDVFVALEQRPDEDSMELRCHILKEDFSYVDYQFAASPSKSGVSFRVRDEDPVKYYGKMVKFFPPKDSVLYNLYMVHLGDNRPLALAEIYNMDFAVICTANKNYPFIICREFVLQEGLTT